MRAVCDEPHHRGQCDPTARRVLRGVLRPNAICSFASRAGEARHHPTMTQQLCQSMAVCRAPCDRRDVLRRPADPVVRGFSDEIPASSRLSDAMKLLCAPPPSRAERDKRAASSGGASNEAAAGLPTASSPSGVRSDSGRIGSSSPLDLSTSERRWAAVRTRSSKPKKDKSIWKCHAVAFDGSSRSGITIYLSREHLAGTSTVVIDVILLPSSTSAAPLNSVKLSTCCT